MEITSPEIRKESNPLPPLVKQSSTYKLIVPKKVEEKIRYLIHKFPHTEWSGILFIKHTGSFENNDLIITCEDLYPMDLGTSGWTEFKMSEDVTAYIADNIELFDCDLALIHSHHAMGSFFSGQDLNTLRSEGNDTNCFVSLIVDTKGTYQAAITRKLQTQDEIVTKSLGTSYEFFGDGPVQTDEDPMSETTRVINNEVIEYFMLDVEREEVSNHLEYLDKRFDEIESRKREESKVSNHEVFNTQMPYGKWWNEFKPEGKELTLFDDKTMKNLEEPLNEESVVWTPNPSLIHHLVCRLITCSLTITNKIDLKQWITRYMEKVYSNLFESNEIFPSLFKDWKETYVEFLLNQYYEENMPTMDLDLIYSVLSEAVIHELNTYPSNKYIEDYIEVLTRYISYE